MHPDPVVLRGAGYTSHLCEAAVDLCSQLNRRKIFWAVVGIALLVAAPRMRAAEGVLVAAAASLRPVLPEIMESFEATHPGRVQAAFGASGSLYRQILRGAPFQVFLAADPEYTARLVGQGRTQGPSRIYALGRVVLYARQGSPLDPEAGCVGLRRQLEAGELRRFAIPNPEHAPYGRAAREVLVHCGLWGRLQPLLVIGENAAQAASFANQPGVQGGILPLSLAQTPQLASRGRHWRIPARWHTPLRHEMVLMKGASETARAFFRHMQSGTVREALERAGFAVPAS